MSENEKNKNRKSAKIIIIIVAIILILVGIGVTLSNFWVPKAPAPTEESTTNIEFVSTTVPEKIEETRVKNPVDFKSLKKQNEDIFAWIKVPGTKVDYPILQSPAADDFYLKHRSSDKAYSASGAIYIQSMNSNTLTDKVTMIYGHNGYKGQTFFTTLHNFEDKEFFDNHEYFYIYTPTSKLTYKIVSAFKYDDRHIMNSFDFHDENIFLNFTQMIQNPTSPNRNVRKLDKEITLDDKIVIMSTCFSGSANANNRYLVCGVLEKNEKTN